MVKHQKSLKQKSNQLKAEVDVSFNNSESPVIQINSEPVTDTQPQINVVDDRSNHIKVKQSANRSKSIETDSSRSDSLSSSSSLNVSSRNERKNSKDQKKIKNKLREEGEKHVAELIAFLHSDKPLIKRKVDFDDDELELVQSLEKAVDLDKFFNPPKKIIKDKLWKTPIVFRNNRNTNINEANISQNGLCSVNRFGEGVPDGCKVALSLATEGRNFENVFKKPLEWNDIIEKADEALYKYENSGKRKSRMARRGSLLQPRFIFLSPHPEISYERVLQSASCLPLREWTSELFLESKESSELLDCETKRNLKWNTSVEDFRHLLSPELSHFGNDVYSMMIEARRRQSLCPPRTQSNPTQFRRKSYHDGQIWAPIEPNKHKKDDYEEKLGIIRQNKPENKRQPKAPQHNSLGSNLLGIPSETVRFEKKKDRINKKQANDFDQTDITSLDNINPKVMANELTLIAKELLLSIKSTEIITLLIRPHSISPDSCPDITAMLGFQKRIIQLVVSFILQGSVTEDCAKRMAYFIEVAEELKLLRNWHSVYSIILSLQSPPIARLRESWRIIMDDYSDLYCEFIELSELIKKESGPLDYTPPSIPLFNDLMDNLKERCGAKYYEVKQHRLHSNWAKPETTIASWVDDEIVDLENVAQDKGKIQKRVDKINKDSQKEHKKGIFYRMLHPSKSKDHSDSKSVSSNSTSRTNSVSSQLSRGSKQSITSDSRLIKAKLFNRNSIDNGKNGKNPEPSCKNLWSVADMQKLNEDDEKEILREIARGLVGYQRNVTSYYLDDHVDEAKNFLLFQSYEGMDVSMKRSLALEPSRKNDKSSTLSVVNAQPS